MERTRRSIPAAVTTPSLVKREVYRDMRRSVRLTLCIESKSVCDIVLWMGSMSMSQNSWSGWDEVTGLLLEYPSQIITTSTRIAGLERWANASWSAVTIPCHESIGLTSIHNVNVCKRGQWMSGFDSSPRYIDPAQPAGKVHNPHAYRDPLTSCNR